MYLLTVPLTVPVVVIAFLQASSNPVNTVFDVKRLIGRKSTDATVKADVQLFPFAGNCYSGLIVGSG